MADDMEQNSGSFMDRIKESPRTVSALIIILIVAAAIYAFSGNKAEESKQATVTATPKVTTSVAPSKAAEAVKKNGNVKSATETPKAVSKEELAKKNQELPKATKTNEAYVEVAQRGDGLTHLARRAATRWLSENQAGYEVTNEHRIFIEDYIRKNMAKKPVSIGQNTSVSFTLIADAVKAAGQLNTKQLQNLTKYTSALK